MRSSFAVGTGAPLVRTPSARQQARRRWLAAGATVLGLVVAGATLGALTAPRDDGAAAAPTGPFSYFPSE